MFESDELEHETWIQIYILSFKHEGKTYMNDTWDTFTRETIQTKENGGTITYSHKKIWTFSLIDFIDHI